MEIRNESWTLFVGDWRDVADQGCQKTRPCRVQFKPCSNTHAIHSSFQISLKDLISWIRCILLGLKLNCRTADSPETELCFPGVDFKWFLLALKYLRVTRSVRRLGNYYKPGAHEHELQFVKTINKWIMIKCIWRISEGTLCLLLLRLLILWRLVHIFHVFLKIATWFMLYYTGQNSCHVKWINGERCHHSHFLNGTVHQVKLTQKSPEGKNVHVKCACASQKKVTLQNKVPLVDVS